jgi:putative endonuclease
MGERCNRTAEVRGSIPLSSTSLRRFATSAGKPAPASDSDEGCPPTPLAKEGALNYVYILQSVAHPDEFYTGLRANVEQRLKTHNAGQSPHTSKYKPWRLISFHYFEDSRTAAAFERYLKSGSGRAFAAKRLRTGGS